jgi:hypothetical protein
MPQIVATQRDASQMQNMPDESRGFDTKMQISSAESPPDSERMQIASGKNRFPLFWIMD